MSNYNPNSQNPGTSIPNLKILGGWQAFSLKDAYQPRSPIRFVVENIFELPSLSIVYGAPGSLKSFLLADLVCCVVAGVDWLPPLPNSSGLGFKVLKSPALWLDFDNGVRRTHERFAALGRTLKLPSNADLHYISMPTPFLDAGNDKHSEDLVNIIAGYGSKIVVVDNLGVISGGADENAAEMIKILSNLRQLSEKSGAAIIVIHHPRKSNSSNGRKGDNLRGHSSIEAALDLALLVERELNSPTISIQPTKVRGADIKPFGAQFTFENDPGGELETARFFGTASQTVTTIAVIFRAIADCLGNETLNKTELTKRVHSDLNGLVGHNRIQSNIEEMVKQDYLTKVAGDNNSQLFAINPNKPY